MNQVQPEMDSMGAERRAHDRPFVMLLVEDEETDAYLVKWALGENQVSVDLHHVFDGREALEFLHRVGPRFLNTPCPDLVLLDLNMPRMGGLECLATIKQDRALRDIPVVVLSTSCDKGDITAAINLGAADYFIKSLDIDQFVEAIRVLGECWVSPALPQLNAKRCSI